MNNASSPFGLPLEAGPLQGINSGDPLNVSGCGSLSEYSVNPPNPQPLFGSYLVLVHDELGILRITGIGEKHKNDKYGQAVRSDFDRVVKFLDGKYGASLKHIVNESLPVGDQSGFAQVSDYLKPSSIWNRDEDFLRALKKRDRLLFKSYFLKEYDPLSAIHVAARAHSFYESFLVVNYDATSFESATSAIYDCPQCGEYKDARHSSCIECSKKTNAVYIRNQNPAEDPQKTSKYDPVRVDTPPVDPEKLQTSAPPPKPPSEASSRPKIRPPGTTGLPNAYERPLKQEVSLDLPADADLPDRFIAALGELIREMKAKGTGQKRYELKEGRRTEAAGGDIFYRFPFTYSRDRAGRPSRDSSRAAAG